MSWSAKPNPSRRPVMVRHREPDRYPRSIESPSSHQQKIFRRGRRAQHRAGRQLAPRRMSADNEDMSRQAPAGPLGISGGRHSCGRSRHRLTGTVADLDRTTVGHDGGLTRRRHRVTPALGVHVRCCAGFARGVRCRRPLDRRHRGRRHRQAGRRDPRRPGRGRQHRDEDQEIADAVLAALGYLWEFQAWGVPGKRG